MSNFTFCFLANSNFSSFTNPKTNHGYNFKYNMELSKFDVAGATVTNKSVDSLENFKFLSPCTILWRNATSGGIQFH